MSEAPQTWRLILSPPAAGPWNMAVDEAIATHAGRGEVPTTLRFYQWDPPCVSLGRHQPLSDIDLDRCHALGYGLVRRPTGGRAILHTDELTYSVAGPQHNPLLAGAVLDSYLRLSQGLLAGLSHLGLSVQKAPGGSRAGTDPGAVCFEVPSAYEIVAGGRKLVGSAQSRRQGWVLQHGTLPLVGDVTRLVDVIAVAHDAERQPMRTALAGRAVTASELLSRPVTFAEAATALAAGFTEALNLRLLPGDLTPSELTLAHDLNHQYASSTWTGKF